jgi:peptidoglycan/LPS O-acetylase OafA/YrhL
MADIRRHDTNNFDLIRLIAASEVAVGHTFTWLNIPLPHAIIELMRCFPGVAIFFVISGFLISRSYVEGEQGVVQFLARRALRIYPALWLQYVFVIVLLACTGGFAFRTLTDPIFWKWLGTAMFMGSNFLASVVTASNPFNWDGLYKGYPADVLWTIPVELGFYLLVPVVFARGYARRSLTGVVILFMSSASVVVAYVAGPLLRDHGNLNSTGMLHTSPAPYFWLFLTGGAIAFYWQQVAPWFERKAHWWFLLIAAGSAINWAMSGSIALPYRIPDVLTVPRALILAGAVIALAHSWTELSSWMRGIDLSYGLYLFHLPFPLGSISQESAAVSG